MTTTRTYTYHRNESGHTFRTDSDGWRGSHAVSTDDTTPEHSTYPTGYDSRCGWCWINAPHTEAAHKAQVTEVNTGVLSSH